MQNLRANILLAMLFVAGLSVGVYHSGDDMIVAMGGFVLSVYATLIYFLIETLESKNGDG